MNRISRDFEEKDEFSNLIKLGQEVGLHHVSEILEFQAGYWTWKGLNGHAGWKSTKNSRINNQVLDYIFASNHFEADDVNLRDFELQQKLGYFDSRGVQQLTNFEFFFIHS